MTSSSHTAFLPASTRLVVADMDGTLLDGRGRVPDRLWSLLERMSHAGVTFAPASGRQYATLAHMFDRASEGMVFVAENGAYVVRDGQELSSSGLGREAVVAAVDTLRAFHSDGRADLGVVVCGKRSAYVERDDRAFLERAEPYYRELARVADVLEVEDEIVKVAVFDFGDAVAGAAEALTSFRDSHQVVVSGHHWVDLMGAGVNKGVAVRRLQERLGITRAETVVFGDYLNDLEMLDEAAGSFAVANAHPEVLERASFRAPSNLDHGVLTTIEELLEARVPAR